VEAAVTVLRITTIVIGVTPSNNKANLKYQIHKHRLAQWPVLVPVLVIHMQPVRLFLWLSRFDNLFTFLRWRI
jgi:hypothetical protein